MKTDASGRRALTTGQLYLPRPAAKALAASLRQSSRILFRIHGDEMLSADSLVWTTVRAGSAASGEGNISMETMIAYWGVKSWIVSLSTTWTRSGQRSLVGGRSDGRTRSLARARERAPGRPWQPRSKGRGGPRPPCPRRLPEAGTGPAVPPGRPRCPCGEQRADVRGECGRTDRDNEQPVLHFFASRTRFSRSSTGFRIPLSAGQEHPCRGQVGERGLRHSETVEDPRGFDVGLGKLRGKLLRTAEERQRAADVVSPSLSMPAWWRNLGSPGFSSRTASRRLSASWFLPWACRERTEPELRLGVSRDRATSSAEHFLRLLHLALEEQDLSLQQPRLVETVGCGCRCGRQAWTPGRRTVQVERLAPSCTHPVLAGGFPRAQPASTRPPRKHHGQ